ncbi:acetyltransferase AlgX (SGNH hydrolase-like protein) [Paraburkholderia caballeronis]|uniref:alginate O-acetyltransferase AlgX-related protein n=1 Tax=Paraburkholderia caballeronis TaxID=416943 RepID=UPI0010655D64|nr:hypothetical protein [Paraburkholderia caballeronis]TDV25337.1 acetyltransferase AlgX (SGNH hydrolase-like protein) [Paraburkholderia caballeronis]
MNILFYIEPWIEKSVPAYRRNSFLIEQTDLMRALLSLNERIDIHAVIGDGVYYSIDDFDAQALDGVTYHVLDQRDLKRIFCNYKEAVRAIYHQKFSDAELSGLKDAYSARLGTFVPDVIFAFESATEHLARIYPQALVLTQYFSPFSRPPFPRVFCFDAFGLYKHSYFAQFRRQLNALPREEEHGRFMDALRRFYFDGVLEGNNSALALYSKAKGDFTKVVMLPLQGSDYFAFDENNDAANQFDYICNVLDGVSPEIGVLVTEHTSRERVISSANVHYLRRKYRNFIYVDELNSIKFHSQFLVKHVDGVVFTSSMVGLQAAMLQKPVFQIGNYESFVSSGNDLTRLMQFLNETPVVNKDAGFYHLFTHFFVPEKRALDPRFLFEFLKSGMQQKRNGAGFDFYRPVRQDPQAVLDSLMKTGGRARADEGKQESGAGGIVEEVHTGNSLKISDPRLAKSVLVGRDGYIFLRNDRNRTQDQISGRFRLSGRDLRAWAIVLDLRRSWFSDHGIAYYYMAAPCKECVYEDYLPEGLSVSRERPMMQVMNLLDKVGGMKIIYPLPALQAAIGARATYPKGDSHWNYYGSYLAYLELMARINADRAAVGATPLKVLQESEIEFWDEVVESDLSSKIGLSDVVTQGKVEKPVARRIQKNSIPNTGNYQVYENADASLPKAVLFRDSFSNYLMGYLAQSFSRLVVVWQPNIDYSIVKLEKPDIVISQQAERFMVAVPDEAGGSTNRGYVAGKIANGQATEEQGHVRTL